MASINGYQNCPFCGSPSAEYYFEYKNFQGSVSCNLCGYSTEHWLKKEIYQMDVLTNAIRNDLSSWDITVIDKPFGLAIYFADRNTQYQTLESYQDYIEFVWNYNNMPMNEKESIKYCLVYRFIAAQNTFIVEDLLASTIVEYPKEELFEDIREQEALFEQLFTETSGLPDGGGRYVCYIDESA